MVTTKLIWWDSRSLYFEQRIQTVHDGFLRAIAFSRATIVNADVEEMLKKVLQQENSHSLDEKKKPELRDDFKLWLEFNSKNSKLLQEEMIVAN